MKVLTICGSLRAASYNRQLLRAASKVAQNLGAEVQNADLKEVVLPMYDQDIQDAGMPKIVQDLKEMVQTADVILFVSPEYNYSVPGVLKNAIDWLSRGTNSLDQKTVAIMGASPGAFGTVRGQAHLRQILVGLNVRILSKPEVCLRFCDQAFDQSGNLVDPKNQEILEKLIKNTFELFNKLK